MTEAAGPTKNMKAAAALCQLRNKQKKVSFGEVFLHEKYKKIVIFTVLSRGTKFPSKFSEGGQKMREGVDKILIIC